MAAVSLIDPDHDGALEMMGHNVAGLLFDLKNSKDLVQKIENLYSQPELKSQLTGIVRKKL